MTIVTVVIIKTDVYETISDLDFGAILADSPGTLHVVETRDNADAITWSPRDILRQFYK